jgi:hypothetical protein
LYRDENNVLQFEEGFRSDLEKYHNDLLEGIQIPVVFADTLKDEVRPIEKVVAGKTRLFSTGPLHFLIFVRMYFLEFMNFVQKRCVECPISIGLNVTSREWHVLYKRLTSKSGSTVAGDFSNFDGLLPRDIGKLWVQLVNAWYNDGPVMARVRELLWEHFSNAFHIIFNIVYQVVDGNPSGQGATSHYNSGVLLLMILIVLTHDFGLSKEDFEIAIYGDDNVITTLLVGLRISHLAPHFKRRFNMMLTHFSKGNVDRDDDMSSIRYLGRAFEFTNGYMKAPLELQTVKEIMYWFKSKADKSVVTVSCAASFFRELSQFPKPVFTEYVKQFTAAASVAYPDFYHLMSRELRLYSTYEDEMYNSHAWRRSGLKKIMTETYCSDFVAYTKYGDIRCECDSTHQLKPETRLVVTDGELVAVRCESLTTWFNTVAGPVTAAHTQLARDRQFSVVVVPHVRAPVSGLSPRHTVVAVAKVRTESRAVGPMSDEKVADAGRNNDAITTRNDQYSSRNTNVMRDTQAVQLGGYQDASEATATAVNSDVLQEAYQESNVEVFNMNRSLERQYVIGTYTWSTSQAQSTAFTTIDFPGALINPNDYLSGKITDFYMFRAGVRLGVRVQASNFLYGKLLVGFMPDRTMNAKYAEAYTDVFNASGYNHIIVGAENSETSYLDIPFISNQRALAVPAIAGQEMGTVFVVVLNPLTNINGVVDTATVVITASFLDAEASLPYDSLDIGLTKVRTESKAEARLKSRTGVISSDNEIDVPAFAALKVLPFVRPFVDIYNTVSDAASAVSSVGAILGLNKPATISEPCRSQIVSVPGWAHGKGMSISNKFAMDPEAAISTAPVVGGVSVDEMDMKYVAGMPMLTNTQTINATTTSVHDLIVGRLGSEVPGTSGFSSTQIAYVDYIIQNFRYWSGSFKFKFYFCASNMHSARVVFYVTPIAPATNTDWQDCYHKIVDIQGSTTTEFTVPYCNAVAVNESALGVNTNELQFYVLMHVLSFSQPVPAVTTPIYLNVYKAAASDFRVGCLLEKAFTASASFFDPEPEFVNVRTESNPRKDFARVFEPIHPSVMGYVPTNLIYPEEYTSISDIVHRQMPYGLATSGTAYATYQRSANWGGAYMGLELWGQLYTFWRGGIRRQYLRKDTTPTVVTMKFSDSSNYVPGLDLANSNKQILEFEIPWYSQFLFESTSVNPPYALINTTVVCASSSSVLCGAAADDFRFHFLKPVPHGSLSIPSTTYGYGAIVTLFT